MRRVKEWSEAYAPRLREEGGVRYRYDGVPLVRVERTYRLLTPLFGGGVEPRLADPVTVVRGTEVRGQLRFWWRAVRGWQAEGDLKRLFDLEAAIFGSAGEGGASPVAVEVEVLEKGREAIPYQDIPGKKFPRPLPDIAHPYVAFPLQRTRQDPRNYPVQQGIRFKLRLMYPEAVSLGTERLDLRQELEAALWAWETFGGIGARTRRGFGALAAEGSKAPTEDEIREGLRRFSREKGWPEGVPHLTPSSVIRVVTLSWREVVDRYQAFRQARNKGGHPKRPGRSLWPEPDEIRRLAGRYAPNHAPRHSLRKFPRGQFGLPIIFHFKDKDQGDPSDATLKPQDKDLDRMASPLLFRPLEDNRCVVAVLEGPRVPPGGVVLEISSRIFPVGVFLTPAEAQMLPFLKGEEDPVRAFVESL